MYHTPINENEKGLNAAVTHSRVVHQLLSDIHSLRVASGLALVSFLGKK